MAKMKIGYRDGDGKFHDVPRLPDPKFEIGATPRRGRPPKG